MKNIPRTLLVSVLVLLCSVFLTPPAQGETPSGALEALRLFDRRKTREQLVSDYYAPVNDNAEKGPASLPLRVCSFVEPETASHLYLLVRFNEDSGDCYDALNNRYVFSLSQNPNSVFYDAHRMSEDYFLPGSLLKRIEINYPDNAKLAWLARNWFFELSIPSFPRKYAPPSAGEKRKPPVFPEAMNRLLDPREQSLIARIFSQEDIDRYLAAVCANPSFEGDAEKAVLEFTMALKEFLSNISPNALGPYSTEIPFIKEHFDLILLGDSGPEPAAQRPEPPRMDDTDLNILREMYETAFAQENRFPRVQTGGAVSAALPAGPAADQALPAGLSLPDGKKDHTASSFEGLLECIAKAKSGDTIWLTNDIPVRDTLNIEKKKLTIRSLEGSLFTLQKRLECRSFICLGKGAALSLRDVALDGGLFMTGAYNEIYCDKASLTLAQGSRIRNFIANQLISVHDGSITLDGGIIKDNRILWGALLKVSGKKGKCVIADGEICFNELDTYNNFSNAIISLETGTCLVEGGAIHHNIGGSAPIYGGQDAAVKMTGGDIYRNAAKDAGALLYTGQQLTITGGSIRENHAFSGALCLSSSTNNKATKASVSGGEIVNNYSSHYYDGITLVAFDTAVTLDIKGGCVQAAYQGSALFLQYKKAKAVVTKGEVIGVVVTLDGAVFTDKRK